MRPFTAAGDREQPSWRAAATRTTAPVNLARPRTPGHAASASGLVRPHTASGSGARVRSASASQLHSRAVLPVAMALPPTTTHALARPQSAGGLFTTPAKTAQFFASRAQQRLIAENVTTTSTVLAMADFERAIALHPTSHRVRHARALALARDGQMTQALIDLNLAVRGLDAAAPSGRSASKAATRALESGAIYLHRGYSLQEAGQHLDALRDFDRGLDHTANDAEYYVARATCLRKLGRYAESIEDYNAARCLESSTLFEQYCTRQLVSKLTADKVRRISRRMLEDAEIATTYAAANASDEVGSLRSPQSSRRNSRASSRNASPKLLRRRVADELHVLSERITAGTADLRRARRQGEEHAGDSVDTRHPNPLSSPLVVGSLDQQLAPSPPPAQRRDPAAPAPRRAGSPRRRRGSVPGLQVERTASDILIMDEGERDDADEEEEEEEDEASPSSERPLFRGMLQQPDADAQQHEPAGEQRRTTAEALSAWLLGGAKAGSPELSAVHEAGDGGSPAPAPSSGTSWRRSSALAAFDARTSLRRSSGLNELFRVSLERAELMHALDNESDGSAYSDDDEIASALGGEPGDASGSGHSFTLPHEQVERIVRALRNRGARTEADVSVLTELLTQAVGESSSFHPLASLLADRAVCLAALPHLRLRMYRRGERLVAAGSMLTDAFLILRGSVSVSGDGPAAAPADAPFDEEDNPPSLAALEAHGLRNIRWALREDASVELSVKLVGGDCVGGADMADAKQLRLHLANGHEQPPARNERFGANVVALSKTLVIAVPIGTLERLYMSRRDANCAQIRAHLSDMQLFKDFPADGLVRLARLMEVVTHARGDVIVEQGQPLGDVCFVRSGQCRASRLVQPPGGAPPVRCNLGLLWSFEWFGELLVLEPDVTASRATITAETITTLYKLPAVHAPELHAVRETLKADFLTRYPSDKVLLARRSQQKQWSSYKRAVVLDVVATSRAAAQRERGAGSR